MSFEDQVAAIYCGFLDLVDPVKINYFEASFVQHIEGHPAAP